MSTEPRFDQIQPEWTFAVFESSSQASIWTTQVAPGLSHFVVRLSDPAESFVSTLRRELLDVEVFHNLMEVHLKRALYLRYYNEERPNSSLRYRPPAKAMLESIEIYS